MSDDDGGAPLEQLEQGILDYELGIGVDTRRGLVQDEDTRIGDESSGQADELPFSHRELLATLANLCVVPI